MKTKIKKSLSLMLAVLMVLSCWVWVAPEKKAAAADYKDGHYYIKVTTNVNDTGNEDNSTITITYKTNNGLGEAKEFVKTYGQMGWDGQSTVFEGYIPGYPTYFTWVMNMGNGRSENHRDITLWIGKDASNCNTALFYSTGYKFENPLIGDTKNTCNIPVNAQLESPRPNTEKSFFYDNSGNVFTANTLVTIPVTGDNTVISKDFNYQVCDQYGVYWYDSPTFNLSKAANGTTDVADEESGFWWVDKGTSGKSVTVKINQNMQKTLSLPLSNTDGFVDYYMVASCSGNDGTAIDSRTIRVTYPKYDWNFDTTVSGTSYTADKVIMQDGSFYDANNDNNPDAHFEKDDYLAYNQKASVYPVSAERDHFTFLGFWTNPQPATGESSPIALESNAKKPISQANYDALDDEEKAGYVVAGEEWNSKDSAQLMTEGNKYYYAWWLADDVSVKFYDIDGKFLGQKVVKAGQSNAVIDIDSTTADGWPAPKKQQYVSGSFSYSNWTGKWEHVDGTEINSKNHTFWSDLILTPVYETVSFTNKYNIAFYNTYGATGMYGFSKEYGYREIAADPKTSDITPLTENDAYTYEFVGFVNWKPTNGNNYHIMLEDVDFDAEGRALNIIEDFTVRANASYYPVFRQHIKSYDVYFEYINEQAEYVGVYKTFKYGEEIVAPEDMPTVYAEGGYEYKFLGWTKGGSDVILSQEVCRPDAEYYAKYDNGTQTDYTITFNYKNEKGQDVSATTKVGHGDYLDPTFVDELKEKPYKEYYDAEGNQMLYFNVEEGKWQSATGTFTYDELYYNFSPTGHTTFNAVYENGRPFHKVIYKDGAKTETLNVLDNEKLPFWTYEVETDEKDEDGNPIIKKETYLPTIADTDDGEYTFLGWYDEPQNDIAATNGNLYVPGETVINGDITLYPQFSFGKFEYNIKFLNYDGTVLEEGTFNYMDSYQDIIRNAEAKAVRPADAVYTYLFLGWDKKVPEFCEGGEPNSTIVFVAQYKPVYIYYTVEWYNSLADMENNAAALKKNQYVYGDRMFTPSVTLTPPVSTEEGRSYVFAGWKYLDGDTVKDFDRNLKVSGNMKFYAHYVLTDKYWTVTVHDSETTSYTVQIQDNTVIGNKISDPIAGYVSDTKHNAFDGWYTTADCSGNKFMIGETPITSDIELYANFTESAHVFNKKQLAEQPSYPVAEVKNGETVIVPADNGEGVMTVWCECDKVRTTTTKPIPALTDNVDPSGTIYIGQWNSANPSADGVFANKKTDLIITTSDLGDVLYTVFENGEVNVMPSDKTAADYNAAVVDVFNKTGKGIGVDKIYLTISNTETNEDVVTDEIVYSWSSIQTSLVGYYGSWEKVPEVYKSYNANVSLKAGAYTLEDGAEYVLSYEIVDIAGNSTVITSAPFIYDITDPAVSFSGDSNDENDKFCKEVEIIVTEDHLKSVTANGTKLTAQADGKYIINTAGYYNIVVEDMAGTKVNSYIQVFADHDYEDFKVDPTCVLPGRTSQKCTVCGDETEEIEIPSNGHKTTTTVTPATCEADGYETTTCSVCGLTEDNYYKVDENGTPVLLYPALGHDWGEGTVTARPTCSTTGVKYFVCKNDASHTKTEEIAVDASAHYFRPAKTYIQPTCTQAGLEAQQCRYCEYFYIKNAEGAYEKIDLATTTVRNIDALGHDADAANAEHYVIVSAPTCVADGSAKLVCQRCGVDITDADGNLITKTLAATGIHSYALVEEVLPSYDAQGNPVNGKKVYRCSICGLEEHDKVIVLTPEARYTVKIFDVEAPAADAEPVYSAVLYKGDIINAAITEPTKASDNEFNYTFSGWYTKNADGSWGSEVDLDSAVVSGDLTLYARFKATKRFYTIQFKSYKAYDALTEEFTGAYEYKSLMGAIGDEVAPGFLPTMAETALNSYEFAGWKDAKGNDVNKIVVTEDGDATYTAVFTVVPKKVKVVFVNYNNTLLETKEITSGASVTYTGAAPTRAYDDDYHYTFKGWDKAFSNITSDVVIKAEYEAEAHGWQIDKISQAATCFSVELTDYKCACGAKKTEQTASALTHVRGEAVPEIVDGEETGYYVVKCTLCGTELDKYKTSFTIKFVDEDKYTVLMFDNYNPDETPVYTGKIPTKNPDKQYTYTFAGFEDEDGNKYAADKDGKVTVKKPTKDETYKAFYSKTTRQYRVTYVDGSNNVLQTETGLDYGSAIPAFEGDVSKIAVPKFTNYVHFVFEKWSVDAAATVNGDMVIRPVFKEVEHTMVEAGSTDPTCTEKGGKGQKCSANCGYQFTDGTVPALGHNYIITSQQDPTDKVPGYINYICTRCQETYTDEIPVKEPILINVTVKDTQGRPIEGARVQLYLANSKVDEMVSDANGKATFKVYVEGEYYVIISNIEGFGGNIEGSIDVGEGSNDIETGDELGSITVVDCECPCHGDNFWSVIFRFFHKIIKLFAGKYTCCSCPSDKY